MKIYRDCRNCNVQNSILTVGMFDGVHSGHRQIISRLHQIAELGGGEPSLLTFWPHPRLFFNPKDNDMYMLTTLDEKIELLKSCGLHNLIIIPFTAEFASLSAQQYIEEFLVGQLNVKNIVVGYDHRFGKKGEGHFDLLAHYGKHFKFGVEEVSAFEVDGVNVSSSKVRRALQLGKIEQANRFLSYNFFVEGKVVEGRKIGRTIGFPTANIEVGDQLKFVPANGVYVVEIIVKGEVKQGVVNIGVNPTVTSGMQKSIEVFIFDFNQNIYGENIRLVFNKKIRDERKFESTSVLKEWIKNDVRIAIDYFKGLY